jgi:hypothetical protein
MGRAVEMEIGGRRWALDEAGGWMCFDDAANVWRAAPEGPGALTDDAVSSPPPGGPRAPSAPHAVAGGPLHPNVRSFMDRLKGEAESVLGVSVTGCGLFATGKGLLGAGLAHGSPLVGRSIARRLGADPAWAFVLLAVTDTDVAVLSAKVDESAPPELSTQVGVLLERWPRGSVRVCPAERRGPARVLDRLTRPFTLEVGGEAVTTLEAVVFDGRGNEAVLDLLGAPA